MDVDKNVWLDKAIHQLYLMREEHNELMRDFQVFRKKLNEIDEKLFVLSRKMGELESLYKDQVVVL